MSCEPLISAIIGGGLAGLFTFGGVRLAEKYNRNRKAEDEKRVIAGLLHSLHDEIEAVNLQYRERMGKQIEALKKGEPLLSFFPRRTRLFHSV